MNPLQAIKRALYAIALCFEYNRYLARAKRDARRNGIDPRNDAEFRAVNGMENVDVFDPDPYQPLFNFLSRELMATATQTEMQEIIRICDDINADRCQTRSDQRIVDQNSNGDEHV